MCSVTLRHHNLFKGEKLDEKCSNDITTRNVIYQNNLITLDDVHIYNLSWIYHSGKAT